MFWFCHSERSGESPAEVCIGGKTPDGKPAVFAIRGFPGGTIQSVTEGGAPAEAAERLG